MEKVTFRWSEEFFWGFLRACIKLLAGGKPTKKSFVFSDVPSMLRCRPTGRNKTFICAIWVFYFGSVSAALWTSRGRLGEHWHPLVTQCVIRRRSLLCFQVKPNLCCWAAALCRTQHGNGHVSKSTVHLAWLTHNHHDMACEVSVWDERWGSSRSVRISTWSERSLCRRSALKDQLQALRSIAIWEVNEERLDTRSQWINADDVWQAHL